MEFDSKHENCIIFLMGFPGVGKLTIAKELAKHINIRVVDNHSWINPVFGLINQDGLTPIPKSIWIKVSKVCDVVFETMCELSPKDSSFVITQGMIEDDSESKIFYRRVLELVQARNSTFLPVRLVCSEETLVQRVQSKERRAKFKAIDTEWASSLSKNNDVFKSGHPHEITINNTNRTPNEVVATIIEHLNKLKIS